MSKRKTITQSLHVTSEDMTFEDQDGVQDDLQQIDKESENGSDARSRFGRAKKIKAIYDPSDNHLPVHKRKKEALALEAAEKALKAVASKTPTKLKSTPVNSPAKRAPTETIAAPAPKVRAVPQKKTPADVAKRLSLDDPAAKPAVVKQRKLSVVPAVPLVKEPSRRIQQRKLMRTDETEFISGTSKRKQRSRSISIIVGTSSISSTYEESSITSVKDEHVPDVRNWTHQQVTDYFNKTLNFSQRDSAIFKDEEIDGETLMIMKRSDIVTTKFQHLKLGTALKMWSHIIKFQTGSNDPSQAWK